MAKKHETSPRKPPSKAGAKPSQGSGNISGIDTTLAANAAAAMVGGKVAPAGGGSADPAKPQPPRKESSTFKQLKAGLNKPSAGALGGVFASQGKQKKAQQRFGGSTQSGHSQTFGSDANRAGVPRRTPG